MGKYVPPFGKEHLGTDAAYADADIISNIAGSIVPAKAMEMLLREIHNTIKLSGLEPSDTDFTQIYKVLQNISMAWSNTVDYLHEVMVIGSNGKLYRYKKSSGANVLDSNDNPIGPKNPIENNSNEYWEEFTTWNKNDVKYLEDAINNLSSLSIDIDSKVTVLKSMHTSDGLATIDKAGHVIPSTGLDIDNSGKISVKLDNNTVKLNNAGELQAVINTDNIVSTSIPLVMDKNQISIAIDDNALIVKENKLSINPNYDPSISDKDYTSAALLNELNKLRKLSIGRPVYHTSTELPDDHAWCNGSFVMFSDRPEFEEAYLSGAFNGMVLNWNASSTDITGNPGKFRKNASNPTGLFLPSNGQLFMRLWNSLNTVNAAGSKNNSGLPNITADGFLGVDGDRYSGAMRKPSILQGVAVAANAALIRFDNIDPTNYLFDASRSSPIYGNSSTVMPESINMPVIMYLGKASLLATVFHNTTGTQQLPVASADELGLIKVNNQQFTVDKYGTLHLNGFIPTSTAPNREILTTSGTYTVEHSGWYKVICIGGGGSGGSNQGVISAVNPGHGGNQGGTTTFGNYLSAIGGSGGGGNSHSYYGSGGGGCGEIKEQYVFLNKDEKITYTIGTGAIINTTISQQGQGPTGGRTILAAYQNHGTGAIGAGDGNLSNTATIGGLEAGGQGGDGAPSPYKYGAGGGGAGGNGVGSGGGTGGKPGSTLATAGEDGTTSNVKKSGGAGAPGAIIIDCMSIIQGSVDSNVTPTEVVITSNSQYSPEVTGWHEIVIIGAGGGGGSDPGDNTSAVSGGGGGSGERKTVHKYLHTREPITISIGTGGTGSTIDQIGTDGGATVVAIGTETIAAEGGKCGNKYLGGQGGGSGISSGIPGQNGSMNSYGDGTMLVNIPGGIGGGPNAGYVTTYNDPTNGLTIKKYDATGYGSGGGGGWGGTSTNPLRSGGSNGCHGAVIIKKMAFGGSQGNGSDIEIATPDKEGLVKPDNSSIKVKSDGTLFVDEIYGIKSGEPYKEVITTNGTWKAPYTGYFKITCIGGGGQGGGYETTNGGAQGTATSFGSYVTARGGSGGGAGQAYGGGGGGEEGELTVSYISLSENQSVPIIIGKGGTGTSGEGKGAGPLGGYPGLYNSAGHGGGGAAGAGNGNSGISGVAQGGNGGSGGQGHYGFGGGGGGVAGGGATRGNSGSPGFGAERPANNIYVGGMGGPGAIIIESVSAIAGPINNEWLNDVNRQRLLSIGRPTYHTSSTLPDDHAWCDGSFVKFSDRPELKIKYESGGFSGMLLPYDASTTTIAANLGKWRPDAAIPTGLYLPSDGNLFYRSWNILSTSIEPGSKNNAGLPNITGDAGTGDMSMSSVSANGVNYGTGCFSKTLKSTSRIISSAANSAAILNIDASLSSSIYGNSSTVMPESINIPVIVYLGKDKIDNTIWYNPELNSTLTSATSSSVGLVKPDNTTTEVNSNGEISVKKNTLKTEFMSDVNYLRKLSIGRPVYHTSTELPDDHAWCDGSFISFENRPEFKEKYEAGGFSGMLLPYNASASDIASNRGKFRPDKSTPTGLYLPSDGGKFYRSWNSNSLLDGIGSGTYNSAGLPNIAGGFSNALGGKDSSGWGCMYAGKDTNTYNLSTSTPGGLGYNSILIDASKFNPIYDNSNTVMPESINIPVIVYLGKTTLGNSVFYDDTPSKKRHNHPLLDTFYSPLESIDGCLSMSINQGLLSRTGIYAEAWSAIERQAGNMLIDDTTWLAEVAANGVCGKFSKGDGSTTFRIPYIARMYLRSTGSDLSNGNYHDDAIRNITGTLYQQGDRAGLAGGSGVFKSRSNMTGAAKEDVSYNVTAYVDFDASLQVPTANENRTKAIAWIPYICMFGVSPLVSQLEMTNLAADIDKIRQFIGQLSFGFPDAENAVELAFTSSGMTYTPDKNGWLYAVGNSTAANQYISINNGAFSDVVTATGSNGTGWPVVVPVTANTKCTIYWNMTLTNLRFIPATNIAPKGTPTSDYSTTETWTGSRWIDGKKIYRLVYKWSSQQTFAANSWIDTPISANDKDVFISGKLLNSNSDRTSNYISSALIGTSTKNSINFVQINAPVITLTDTIIIEYTKKSDD